MTTPPWNVMVFNFPPCFCFSPLNPQVQLLITAPYAVLLLCECAEGGRYLSISAILQDTKRGVVMSAVMSSCQGNRSVPLAQRSDRWDGFDLCEAGWDKDTSFPHSHSFIFPITPCFLLFRSSFCCLSDSISLTRTGFNNVRCQREGLAALVHRDTDPVKPLLLSFPLLLSSPLLRGEIGFCPCP